MNKNQISIVKDSVITFCGDAIVNAANTSLLGGGGVDGAIHMAAGSLLLEECKTLGGCKTGDAKITNAYKLKCKKIIHTVGPIYMDGKHNEAELLKSCYTNIIRLAKENNIMSIGIPGISIGVYGYPLIEATKIALSIVLESDYSGKIVFFCFKDSEYKVYSNLINDL